MGPRQPASLNTVLGEVTGKTGQVLGNGHQETTVSSGWKVRVLPGFGSEEKLQTLSCPASHP